MASDLELQFQMAVTCHVGAGVLCRSAHLPAKSSPRHITPSPPPPRFLKIYYFYSLSFLRQGRHISGWPGVCRGVEEVLLPAPPECWEHRPQVCACFMQCAVLGSEPEAWCMLIKCSQFNYTLRCVCVYGRLSHVARVTLEFTI